MNHRLLAALALMTLYMVWGSTYLAISVMVRTIPPLIGAGLRFVAAGFLLYGWLALRGGRRRLAVTRREFVSAAIVGLLMLAAARGLVTLAQRHIPSGLAALLIASVPLWVVLLRLLGGERIRALAFLGVTIGFAGVALLAAPGGLSGSAPLVWLLTLLVAATCEAAGGFYSSRLSVPSDPLLAAALEMLIAGPLLLLVGIATGEAHRLNPSAWSGESIIALLYLIVPGAVLAYATFVWLLSHMPVSTVSTYAYVNPVVALLLGWILLDEQITLGIAAGASLIIVAVVVVIHAETAIRPAHGKDVAAYRTAT